MQLWSVPAKSQENVKAKQLEKINSVATNPWFLAKKKMKKDSVILSESSNPLQEEFNKVKQQQGLIGKAWDGVKNIFGAKSGSKSVEKIIKQVSNGKLTEEEGRAAIEKYKEGQKMCVDVVADLASGILSVGAFALTVATGGIAGGLIAATLVGTGLKVGIKAGDAKATGKEYTGKDLLYDTATGAINGLLAPITNGIGNCVTKTIAKKLGLEIVENGVKLGAKEIVKQGVKQSIKSGMISKGVDVTGGTIVKRGLAIGAGMAIDGALGGAADNAVRAGLEGQNVISGAAQGAVGGLIMSPLIGGGFRIVGKAASKVGSKIADKAKPKSCNIPIIEPSEDLLNTLEKIKSKAPSPINTPKLKPNDSISVVSCTPTISSSQPIGNIGFKPIDLKNSKINFDLKDLDSNFEKAINEAIDGSAKKSIPDPFFKPSSGFDSKKLSYNKIDLNKPNVDSLSPKIVKPSLEEPRTSSVLPPSMPAGMKAKIDAKFVELKKIATSIEQVEFTSPNGKKAIFQCLHGTQSGSNAGFWAKNITTGELFYVKIGGEQSVAEAAAARLYQLAGIDVPNMRMVTRPDGSQCLISQFIPDVSPVTAPTTALSDGFGMDVLLANWDALCSNNAVTDGSKVFRIDLGSVFDFRAQGLKKPFTGVVDELTTLLDPSKNPKAAQLLSTMTKSDMLASLKKVIAISDDDLIKTLKEAGMADYIDVILKRKQFIKQFVEKAESMPVIPSASLFDFSQTIKCNVLSDTIKAAKTQIDIADIQTAINSIQDPALKTKLQQQLNAQSSNIKSCVSLVCKPVTKAKMLQVLDAAGFKLNPTTGKYELKISDMYKAKIIANYGQGVGSKIMGTIGKPIDPSQINDLLRFMNIAGGKYTDYWQAHPDELIAYFQVLSSNKHGIFKHFDSITDEQWSAVMNAVKFKSSAEAMSALYAYKGSSTTINGALTKLKNETNPQIHQSVLEQIDAITKYIDTQVLTDTIHVYRGEGFQVLNSVVLPNGKKLGDVMQELTYANDKNAILKFIKELQLGGNLVAHQERFMSTSLVQSASFDSKRVIWDLEVPAGSKGVFLEGANLSGGLAHEVEYLIQRGSHIQITDMQYDFAKGQWILKGKLTN